jgi:hypothetical protein
MPIVTQKMTAYDGAFHSDICETTGVDFFHRPQRRCGIQLPSIGSVYTDLAGNSKIGLRPGDLVTIFADGCVQTGGFGGTWKRYVNPQGRNADRLYHGTLGVLNAVEPDGTGLPNPVRIQDLLQGLQPVWIPVGQPLRLGYEDDNYSDNGYWGHDNGNPPQCNLDFSHGFGGNAFVTVVIQHDQPQPGVPTLRDWDVVRDDLDRKQFDFNALLFNPRWQWQTTPPQPNTPPLRRFDEDCPSVEECTTQAPTTDNGSIAEHVGDTASIGAFGSCNSGHLNWETATYKGRIFWKDHSFWDDDYDLLLVPSSLSNGFANGVTGDNTLAPTNEYAIKLEFDEGESIDYFVTQFWQDFRAAVHNDNDPGGMVDGKEAVVIGLLGLDRAHGSRSELHPVFALAIHVNSGASDDHWAFFIRNYGNEGFCSDNQHYIESDLQAVTLQLPRLNTVSNTAKANPRSGTPRFATNIRQFQPPEVFAAGSSQDTFITVFLPPPPNNGDEGAWWSGDLHLEWKEDPSVSITATALVVANAPGPAEDEGEGDPEAQLTQLFETLTPQQQADVLAILPPRIVAVPQTFLVEPVFVDNPPLSASVPPVHTFTIDPRLQRRRADIAMSFCGATNGKLESDLGSCVAGDLDGDTKVDCSDLAIVKAAFGKRKGQSGYDLRADTDGSGVVDIKDLAFVAQKLPAGTQCP